MANKPALRSVKAIAKFFIRSMLFGLREAAGRPAFSPEDFKDMFLAAVKQLEVQHAERVIVLSAFPCDDWTTNTYRQRLNAAMKDVCEAKGFVYVEAFGALVAAKRSGMKVLHDSIHISPEAHEVVAQTVLDRLAVSS